MMSPELVKEVEIISKSKPVVIFMKGTPQAPQCGFSARAVQVLKEAGVTGDNMMSFDVLSDGDKWGALEALTHWPTVPQIFIKGQFIGGCDIISEIHERGDLTSMIQG